MITVISSTNRPNANSLKVAQHYLGLLEAKNVPAQLFSLASLPDHFIQSEFYGERSEGFAADILQYVSNAQGFVFVVPEYNGGFPGLLKAFIDSVPPSEFRGKKAALVGLSAGRTGNIVGMAHFCDILHYLGVEVLSSKPKLSMIESLLDENGKIINEESRNVLEKHVNRFLKF